MTTYRHPDTGETIRFSGDNKPLERAGWDIVEDKPAPAPRPPAPPEDEDDDE